MDALNSPFLSGCNNIRPSEHGLKPLPIIDYPFATQRVEWPYPMLYQGKRNSFMLHNSSIHSLNMSGADWTHALLGNLEGGNRWSIADFYDFFILTNGTNIVYYNAPDASITSHDFTAVPLCNVVHAYRGQLLCGGILCDWYDCDEEFIAWSAIGSVNCVPDERNEAGYAPLGIGEIFGIGSVGKNIIACGETGIVQMFPASQPTTAFGMEVISDTGVAGVGSCGQGRGKYIFIDNESRLWRFGKELEKLNYSEWLEELTIGNVVISYDRVEDVFYICDGEVGFALSNEGLCKVGRMPTGLYRTSSDLKGVYLDSEMDEAMILTNPMDFGSRGRKFIAGVELGVSSKEDVYVTGEFKNEVSGEFMNIGWRRCSPSGYTYLGISGVELKLGVWCDTYEDFNLDYIKIGVKYTDKTFRRGHASTTIAGAD